MESLKLIVVEDEDIHFELIKRAILKEYPSAVVHHFRDAVVCLARLKEILPDIIITDYRMPGMDGLEFLEVMQRERKDIPIIVITALGDVDTAVKAMKMGAWDFLLKSCDCFAGIPGIVEKVLRERALRSSLRESERLNTMLLNVLPHPAMLINKDRRIISANPIAEETGAVSGGYCWRDFGHSSYLSAAHRRLLQEHRGETPPSGIRCTFCLADQALAGGKPANAPEIEAFGKLWDAWWIPMDHETYLHYAVDITNRKLAEERIRDLTRLLIKAQEGGRKKLAYDLHDTIGQDLSSLKIGIDTLLDDEPGELRLIKERLWSLSEKLEGTIRAVRDLAYNLRPPTLDELGLARTIYQYCEELSAAHGLDIDFHAAGMDAVKPDFDTRITLYRLVQEALNNVRKHAEASHVSVRLVASYPKIILRVEDDGKGFDVQTATAPSGRKCLGLKGMEERVALLHGRMHIDSRPMQGTRIRIEVPFEG